MNDSLEILHNLLNSVVIADTKGSIVFVNNAFLELFKYQKEDIIGQNISVIIPNKYKGAHKMGMDRYMSTGDKKVMDAPKVKLEGLKSDGEVFPITLRLTEVILNQIRHFFSSIEDLTELAKQERISQLERERVDNIARFPEENPSIVFRISKDHNMLYSNDTATEFWKSLKTLSDKKSVLEHLYNRLDHACEVRESFYEEYSVGDKVFYVSYVPVLNRRYLNVYASDITRYSNRISLQSKVLLKYNNELVKYNEDLNDKVKDQIKSIVDSINYSKNIQRAILENSKSVLDDNIDHFILYQPRDVVSGDFYWAHRKWNGELHIAVGDCTGHGIPGAFLTILATSLLNEIVISKRITNTGDILNRLREDIIKILLHNDKSGISDGLDIAIVKIDPKGDVLEYSGANIPIYLYRGGKIRRLSTNSFSIGYEARVLEEFKTESFKIKKGDRILVSTDGYPDQFGGDKNKKLKRKKFSDIIFQTSQLDLENQGKELHKFITEWSGLNDQVDDITIMGLDLK